MLFKIKSKKLWLSIGIMFFLTTFLPIETVEAADVKVYPACMCVEKGKDTGDFNRSMYRITRNGSAGSGILLCPIVRDTVRSTSIGREHKGIKAVAYPTGFRVRVWTYRTDSGPSIRLTLHNRAYDGSSITKVIKYAGVGARVTEIFAKSKANSGYYLLEVEMGINGATTKGGYAKLHSYEVVE
jgi:hypothetical protein